MGKIDYKNYILPDIEMYAGNTDVWDFQLSDGDMNRFAYDDVKNFSFKLTIVNSGYMYRTYPRFGAEYFSLIKNGTCVRDGSTNDAIARFTFERNDTVDLNGKYLYQLEITGNGQTMAAQGNLYIERHIGPDPM